jgi:hypothetical protein
LWENLQVSSGIEIVEGGQYFIEVEEEEEEEEGSWFRFHR